MPSPQGVTKAEAPQVGVVETHCPLELHVVPAPHEPHDPRQPSSPQDLPAQSRVHVGQPLSIRPSQSSSTELPHVSDAAGPTSPTQVAPHCPEESQTCIPSLHRPTPRPRNGE